MKNIYLQILDQQPANAPLVLATVVSTQGSTPQKPGSSALFYRGGLLSGTVGGGVVEEKVRKAASDTLITGNSKLLSFNLNNDISYKEEAICGGLISVLLDSSLQNHLSVFREVKSSLEDHVPGVMITMVTRCSDEKVSINRYWMTTNLKPLMPGGFSEKIEPEVMKIISAGDPSGFRELEILKPGDVSSYIFFLEPVFPPLHLVIAGAGHIGKALAHLGNMIGFDVTVIDDRAEYANSENIPGARIVVDDIGRAMTLIKKNSNTFVVIVTRGHKDDALALKPCIDAGLAYTGMIGSKKKIADMRSDFIRNGWANAEQWKKIYAPIGLDIKSQTVEEIAVSIAAQLVLVRNSRKIDPPAGGRSQKLL